MPKWFGTIGFFKMVETSPGIWEDSIDKKSYYGEVEKNFRRIEGSDGVNDNIRLSNQISILSDSYIDQNFHNIRYIEFMGANWKVENVEIRFPRLILTIGGVYNG